MKRIESTVEREEEELGGFVRNHRPTGPPREEKPNGRKKPRHSRVLLQNLVPPDEPEVAHTGVVKPPEEKKEVKEMTNNVTPVKEKKIPFPIPGFVMCPACGQYSKHIVLNGQPYIVCIGCDNKYYAYRKDCDEKYRVYADQVAAEIAAGKNPVVQPKVVQFKPEWLLARLDIASIEKELADARLMMEVHNKRYPRRDERIAERVRAKAEGKTFSQEVLVSLRKLYGKEIIEEDSNNAKSDIALVLYLNTWLTAAKTLKPELEKMIAERVAKAAAAPEATAPALATPGTTALLVIPEPAPTP